MAGIMPCGVYGARNPVPIPVCGSGLPHPTALSRMIPVPGAHPCRERAWGTKQGLVPHMLMCVLSSIPTACGPVCVCGHQDYR